MPAEVQPPPDPRALLAVLEAQRRSESASRAELTSSALDIARDQNVGDLQVRRAADAYADAVQGFIRPTASTGYVFAALYAMRRRVARWIGIPFVLLSCIAAGIWGYDAFEKAQRLEKMKVHSRAKLRAARAKYEEAAAVRTELDRLVRAERPVPPNLKAIQGLLVELEDQDTEIRKQFERTDDVTGGDERSIHRLRHVADRIPPSLEEFEQKLNGARELFLKGREILRIRARLDFALTEAQSLHPPPPLGEARAIHLRGVLALDEGETEAAAEHLAAMTAWVQNERETAALPDQINALLAQVKELTRDEDALSRAAALHRQGRWSFDRSERLQAKESIRQLQQLVADLNEEYLLIITGGKWRYRNNNPSIRTYYVLVEAVAPNGARLAKHIWSEEDGTGATVKQWGERVPFSVYERVRLDKQDNGRIDQDVFGRKQRGRLQVDVMLRSDDGEILPRGGQITRW